MIECIAEQQWDEDAELTTFITEGSDNGTLYHRPQFLAYHAADKFLHITPVQYKFYKDKKLVGYINGAFFKVENDTWFASPFGSSYGGLLFGDLAYKDIEEACSALVEELSKECQYIKIGTTSHFLSKAGKSAYLDYIFLSKGFTTSKADVIMVHALGDEETLIKRIDRKTYTELKQPLFKQPLRIEVIDGIDEQAYNLLLESQSRFGSKPTHTFKELQCIEELVPGTIKTYKTYIDDTFLSGIIAFHVSKEVLNTFYIFDSNEGRNYKANHFTYYQLLSQAYNAGYKYVDFGSSTFGWEPNYYLIAFKEKFAAVPFLRNTFVKKLGN